MWIITGVLGNKEYIRQALNLFYLIWRLIYALYATVC
jgi:hypothetical protein